MTTDNTPLLPSPYRNLDDIRLRKQAILDDIRAEDAKIRGQWNGLFHKPAALSKNQSPSKRMAGFMSMGAGMIDAVMLGWKLYRKFKK